jgi:hypothetical protein
MRWLVLLLLVACGDNLDGISVEERQGAENAARCEQLTRCGLFLDRHTCVEFRRPSDERALRAAISTGIIKYSATAERTCLEELAAKSCDRTARDNRTVPFSCQGALQGTRLPGSTCAFDEECLSGRCEKSACDPSTCCPGICRPLRKGLGGECERTEDCTDGAFCFEMRCSALLKAGAKCTLDSDCDFGLACASGTCRKLPSIGESCPYERCADIGARCVLGYCQPVGLPGKSCTTEMDCSLYARCNSDIALCENVPTLGMPCDGRCAGGARCANGVCGPPLQDGEPCTAYSDCASELCAEGPIFDFCAASPVCY